MTTARATRILAVGLTGAALLFAGCGDDDNGSESTAADTAAQTTETTATTPAETTRVIANPFRRPVHRAHPGARVDQLIIKDVTVGDGETLEPGDTATVDYEGTIYQTGRRFDGSWRRGGEPIELLIDNGSVIGGWWQGLQGMRVGGRRTLVIPPELGYGEQDQGTIPPNSTLYFTVDLLGLRKAQAAGAAGAAGAAPPAG